MQSTRSGQHNRSIPTNDLDRRGYDNRYVGRYQARVPDVQVPNLCSPIGRPDNRGGYELHRARQGLRPRHQRREARQIQPIKCDARSIRQIVPHAGASTGRTRIIAVMP